MWFETIVICLGQDISPNCYSQVAWVDTPRVTTPKLSPAPSFHCPRGVVLQSNVSALMLI